MRHAKYLHLGEDAPDWFDLTNYDAAATLDEEGWAIQIGARLAMESFWRICQRDMAEQARLSEDFGFDIADGEPHQFQELYEDICGHITRTGIIPLNLGTAWHDDWIDLYRGENSSPVRTLTNRDAYGFYRFSRRRPEIEGFLEKDLDDGSYPPDNTEPPWCDQTFTDDFRVSAYLGVDLALSDAELVDEFRTWLKEQRNSLGHDAAIKRLAKSKHLDKWAEHRVLPLWDLQHWAETKDKRFTYEALVQLLFPEEPDAGMERVKDTAQTHLRVAKAAFPALKARMKR